MDVKELVMMLGSRVPPRGEAWGTWAEREISEFVKVRDAAQPPPDPELRKWIAGVWDAHLDRCGLEHTKRIDRKATIEQLAQIFEAARSAPAPETPLTYGKCIWCDGKLVKDYISSCGRRIHHRCIRSLSQAMQALRPTEVLQDSSLRSLRTEIARLREKLEGVAEVCQSCGCQEIDQASTPPTDHTHATETPTPVNPMQQWHSRKYAGQGVGAVGPFRVVIRTDRKTEQQFVELLHDDDAGGYGFTKRQLRDLIPLFEKAVGGLR